MTAQTNELPGRAGGGLITPQIDIGGQYQLKGDSSCLRDTSYPWRRVEERKEYSLTGEFAAPTRATPEKMCEPTWNVCQRDSDRPDDNCQTEVADSPTSGSTAHWSPGDRTHEGTHPVVSGDAN